MREENAEAGEGPAPVPSAPGSRADAWRRPEVLLKATLHWTRWRATQVRIALHDRYLTAAVLAAVAYGVIWTYISVSNYYSGESAVYDLGLVMLKAWWYANPGPVGAWGYLTLALDEPFEFLMMPVGVIGSYPLLLGLQSFALGAGAIPLYGIGRRALSSKPSALLLSFAYLLYFPLGGVNWFDAHFIAFFIPLFLIGFYCYQLRSYWWAGVILGVAGTTEYPVILLIFAFSVTLLLEGVLRRLAHRPMAYRFPWRFTLLLFVCSGLFFAYQYVFLATALGPGAFAVTAHTTYGGSIPTQDRTEAILLLLAPALFLSIVSPRWLLMLGPAFYLIAFSSYAPLTYPSLFRSQYSALFVPFVFLGAIGTLQGLGWGLGRLETRFGPVLRKRRWYRRMPSVKVVTVVSACVLVSSAYLALYYQPYGPWNDQTPWPFGFQPVTPAELDRHAKLADLEALIPRSSAYVLFQNDMPNMLPRTLDYLQTPEVTGVGNWQNVTSYDAAIGSFPNQGYNGTTIWMRVNYMIDDPYSWGFTEVGTATDNSMYHFIQVGYESGHYGILGESDGMVVLERGYSGAIQLYSPYQQSIAPSELVGVGPNESRAGGALSISNTNTSRMWTGPSITLSPGWCNISYQLQTTDLAASNHVTLGATAENGQISLASLEVYGNNFTAVNRAMTVTMHVYVPDTYEGVDLPGSQVSWSGTLSVLGIEVSQSGAGAALYTPL